MIARRLTVVLRKKHRWWRTRSLALVCGALGVATTVPLRFASGQDSTSAKPVQALVELSLSPVTDGATLLGNLHLANGAYVFSGSRYGFADSVQGFSLDVGLSLVTQYRRGAGWYIRLGIRHRRESAGLPELVSWRTRFMTDFGMYFRTGTIRPLVGFPVVWGKPWPEAIDIVVGVAVAIP